MEMGMERIVLTELLFDISKIKTVEIDLDWFVNKEYRYIAEDIIISDGEDSDFIMMEQRIKSRHNDSRVTKDLIFELATEASTNSNFEKHSKEMKIRYYERRLAEYSKQYSDRPTTYNYKLLKDEMALLDEIRNAEEDIGDLDPVVEELYYEMENGVKSGVHTFETIDFVLGDGMYGGMLMTLAARPSVGKTTMAVNMGIQAMNNNEDVVVDFFSLEMTRKEMLKKFIGAKTGINSYKFVNTKLQLSDQEKARVVAEAEWLKSMGIGIMDRVFKIDDIIRTIRRRKYSTKGKYIAVIDYLQLVQTDSNVQRYLQIGEITRKLKQVANVLDIPILILSQVGRGVESRENKTPTLADLRESGDIEQDSSVVCFLSKNEDDEGLVDFTVAKNRNGATAKLDFRFLKSKSLFEEVRR